ncbi:DUF2145 domain-containing protein [uncultured Desulfobacter sp.]|uniref:DUF2145 domain-containing protein n=1 Tax=uncultured Desulfobacter sp. TaxID=240139 RepID=UPI0029F4A31A|nr:DUF2145 domain-containing protein [uncultured Desulfobacter sp.]
MKYIKLLLLLLPVIFFALPENFVFAGSSQTSGEIHFKPEEIIKFSKKVEKTLAQKGARVAIIARVGRPRNKLPEGINFTHTAIAIYSQITTADGRKIPGYAIYNLYQRTGEPDVSDLVQDFPVDFFAGVEVLEAGIIIPSPELQKRLLNVLVSPTYKELHNPHYSVIANPFTLAFQNCTEHTLDIITAAIYETSDIKVIKANEKAYFEPQPVNVNPVKLLLGSMFVADVTTSDHPGSPVTSTFTSIGKFLTKYNAVSEILTITLDT